MSENNRVSIFSHKNTWIVATVFFALSLMSHLYHISSPTQYVWDECFHVRMAHAYLTKEIIPDIHPPTGKIFIYLGVRIFGLKHNSTDDAKGDDYHQINNKTDAIMYRYFSALCGSFIVPLIWIIVLDITASKLTAWFSALLALFDTALLYQTRIAVLEPYLLLSMLMSIIFFLQYIKKGETKWLIFGAISAGMCFAVKWTGLSFIGWGFCILLYNHYTKKTLRGLIISLPAYIILASMPYLFFYTLHYTLISQKDVSYFKRFIDDHIYAVKKNARTETNRKDSSKYYKWLLGVKPINAIYKSKKIQNANGKERIYRFWTLIPNPAVWHFIFIMTYIALCSSILSFLNREEMTILSWLLILFMMNWIPYAFIKRAMFLYHYLPAFLVSIIISAIILDRLSSIKKNTIIIIMICASFFYWWLNRPLVTGKPLTLKQRDIVIKYNPGY